MTTLRGSSFDEATSLDVVEAWEEFEATVATLSSGREDDREQRILLERSRVCLHQALAKVASTRNHEPRCSCIGCTTRALIGSALSETTAVALAMGRR
jgi:hypothetical protein